MENYANKNPKKHIRNGSDMNSSNTHYTPTLCHT